MRLPPIDDQPRQSFWACLLRQDQSFAFSTLLLVLALPVLGSASRLTEYSTSTQLKSLGSILDANAPLSFPEKIVAAPNGNLYLLDTELANVFVVNKSTRQISPLCAPRMPMRPSDISLDNLGRVWVVNSQAKRIARFDDHCQMQTSFTSRGFPISLQVNTFGEIVVLTSQGDSLFEVYSSDGKLVRTFGQRLSYGDPIADSELSAGHLVADSSGGFYLSLNYPPVIRHYARDGRLLTEFKPDSDVKIEPPQISSRAQGNRLTVSSRYQILVLDLGIDPRGRLLLLMSGENKFQALTKGSRSLLVTTRNGATVAKLNLEDGPFNRLAAANGMLYMLRNREPLRLNKFAVP